MKALRFNQDATCCVIIQDKTVGIYNCDPFGKCFSINCEDTKGNTHLEGNNNESSSTNHDDSEHFMDREPQINMMYGDGLTPMEKDSVVEMLFSTSLVAMASGNNVNRRKLKIINTKRNSTICELVFPSDVIDVVMNRKRMCILLSSDQIFIYDISCMKPLESIDLWEDRMKLLSAHHDQAYIHDIDKLLKNQLQNETNGLSPTSESGSNNNNNHTNINHNPNSRARRNSIRSKICPRIALSNDDRSILAFTTYHTSKSNPNSHLLRDIIIYDAMNVKPINYLNNVHRGNISCLAINHEGTLISTASDKGTIIRVYNTGITNQDSSSNDDISPRFSGKNPLLTEFRRGNRPCNLYQLTFNLRSTLVGCVGDSGTIHIFKLDNPYDNGKTGPSSMSKDSSSAGQDDVVQQVLEANSSTLGASQQSNLEKSKQMAHFLSKRIKASIPNQNLQRDYAHINVADTNIRYCLGFPDEFPNQVYLAGDDGRFRTFSMPQTSGRCVLSSTNTFM